MTKILFVVNSLDFFISHRLPIAKAAQKAGFDVHVATSENPNAYELTKHNLNHHIISLNSCGYDPIKNLKVFFQLVFLYLNIKPMIVHLVTIRPILFGGLAARFFPRLTVIFAISGLGTVFISKDIFSSILRQFVKVGYYLCFRKRKCVVILQNNDDEEYFYRFRLVQKDKVRIIHGSGVDLDLFPFTDEPRGICCVSMACRLLKEKGINEFIEAAKILHDRNVLVNMNLYGSVDHGNPSSLTMLEMSQIKDSAHVNFLGYSESISEVYIASHIVCLPSYREGLPKSLIEGAACGRAIVTTDVPGCRKAIIPNVSGLLVPKQDPMSLANAIQFLVENPSIRMKMGQRGRAYCKSNFGINRIVDAHLEIYKELISKRSEVQ